MKRARRTFIQTFVALVLMSSFTAACGDEGPPKEIEVNGRTCVSTVSDLDCDFSKG